MPDRPVRIANCSGFYGDRAAALREVVSGGPVDVVTGDYLAEVTMMVLAKARLKDPAAGYATTFLPQLEPVLAEIAQRGIKVVVNAGGLNPGGLAALVRTAIARSGVPLRVAHVEGDDVLPRVGELALPHLVSGQPLAEWSHEPVTANAYLGGLGIARALRAGADVVIAGRVADASLVVGSAAWWWDWAADDFDALAGAVAAGHVIECGPQATGGNFSGFSAITGLESPGFPIAEIAADGSSVITKHDGTGGAVTTDTVTAQLVYEIGAPAYLNPDVVAHLDTLTLEQVGPDRVAITGTRGSAPPSTTKVAVTAIDGWRNFVTFALTGLDVDAKAALVERTVRATLAVEPGLRSLSFELLGTAAPDPLTQGAATALLTVGVVGTQDCAGRSFSRRMVELGLSSYPGLYYSAPPSTGSACGVYWPGLIEQSELAHRVVHADGTTELVPAPPSPGLGRPPVRAAEVADEPVDEPVSRVPLGHVALARSGDKGGVANVGVWAGRAAYPWLRSTLTAQRVATLLPEAAGLPVEVHELPNLHAVNVVIHDLLGTGATSTTRFDGQAKALGEWLRARYVEVPNRLLRSAATSSTPG